MFWHALEYNLNLKTLCFWSSSHFLMYGMHIQYMTYIVFPYEHTEISMNLLMDKKADKCLNPAIEDTIN